jgi:superfamily I DNA/RNA helicase
LRRSARELFASALETPGGLKVQTIHALCTRLLQQFPFEANVPARFTVLDERDQTEMMERASLALKLDASRAPYSAVGRALQTAMASAAEHKQRCSKYDVKKDGSGVVVEATCNMNGRDVESRTEMSGDFQKTFNVKITSTTSGIQDSQSIAIDRVIEQQGTYLGESCGDLKAGEAMGSDGTRLMVQ